MSTIFSILFKNEKRISKESFDTILDSLNYWQPDNRYTWSNDQILLGNLLLNSSSQSIKEHNSNFFTESQCIIISDSRLDYRSTLVKELGEDWELFKDYPDNYYILKSYLKWGENCVQHIFGDFAFAIWDNTQKKLFCARDHFGIRPFYYCNHPDYFIISSDFMAFNRISGLSYKIREQYILDAICSIMPDKGSSAFSNINKLEPAHYLIFQQDAQLIVAKYWELAVNENYSQLNEEEAIQGLRNRFIDSLDTRIETNEILGLELSGGLDSSSIAACLPYVSYDREQPFYTFTHSMSPEQNIRPRRHFDTFELCQEVFKSSLFIKHNKITGVGQAGSFAPVLEFLEFNLKPIQQAYALMSDQLYEEAESIGVRILFSGYGGDEGVTFNGTVYLLELAYQKEWTLLKTELRKKVKKDGGSYLWTLIIFIFRVYAGNLYEFLWWMSPFHNDLFKRQIKILALSESLKKKSDIYKRYLEMGKIADDPNVRLRQYKRLTSGYMSDRIENSYYAARNKRIEYRYPFLDVKLVEFFYSLKSEFKYKDGTKRYLFRKAMEGILDDRIRLNPGKFGATIPNIKQRLIQDEHWFKEIINEGKQINSFHYVDYDRMLKILEDIKSTRFKSKTLFIPKIFFSAFSVLILQKWQREGKIDIGIKC